MKIRTKVCEKCSFSALERVPRTFWMRALYKLRYYHCDQCNERFLAPKELVEQRQWMDTTGVRLQPPGRKKKA